MWARSYSKNNVSCDTLDSSHNEYCETTCAFPLRAGKHLSLCSCVSAAVFACRTIPRFCPHGTQLLGACAVGARTHLAREFIMRHLVFAVALASIRHVRTQNALVDSDRSASDLMQRTQRNVPCSLWSDTLYFFFVLVAKIREMTRPSLTIPSLTRLMMLRRTRTALVQWCVAACMRAATCALEGRWCARSQGEHLSHRTRSLEKQSGRRRRHCPRRNFEGNGFDVYAVRVQGMCLLLPKMSLYMEV